MIDNLILNIWISSEVVPVYNNIMFLHILKCLNQQFYFPYINIYFILFIKLFESYIKIFASQQLSQFIWIPNILLTHYN